MTTYNDDDILIDAEMATQIIENEWSNADPFTKSWDDLIGLKGLNKNFKRRETRKKIEK